MTEARITGLFIYPIKSCAGIALQEVELGELGLKHDREWVIVDSAGKVLTQRDYAKMALIKPLVQPDDSLTLIVPDREALQVVAPSDTTSNTIVIKVWGDDSAGFDQGPEAAALLTDYLETECRLLRNDKSFIRKHKQKETAESGGRVTFVDSCQLLVISEESLEGLNNLLDQPLPMNRFRPSIVLRGLGSHGEDHADSLITKNLAMHPLKTCSRCVVTTIDQETGTHTGQEPLKTLNTYRNQDGKIKFGRYYMSPKPGSLRVGDSCTVGARPDHTS